VTAEPRAVLDVGSNTIRLLVGRVEDGTVDRLLDSSEFVRLGKDVDASGELRQDRMDAAVGVIAGMAEQARDQGAGEITAIATSAVRDARNGQDFVRRVQDETGVSIEIIAGDREAALTFRGATIGVDLEGGVVVCDLGGGSAELIAADEGGVRWATSKPLGSGRLSERFVRHDPPRRDELDAVRRHVTEVLSSLPDVQARCAVYTGGTATHLGMLAGKRGHLQALDPRDFDRVLHLLCSTTASDLSERYQIRPERAAVLPAGIAALDAIARFYAVERILISLSGIREGALLEASASSTHH
jgi:exopolyphosphatase / guanosine-5'-triphosphate,3'-diphosphate pyrophosphatase